MVLLSVLLGLAFMSGCGGSGSPNSSDSDDSDSLNDSDQVNDSDSVTDSDQVNDSDSATDSDTSTDSDSDTGLPPGTTCDKPYEERCFQASFTDSAVWTVCDDEGKVITAKGLLPFTCSVCAFTQNDKRSTGCICGSDDDCPAGYQFCLKDDSNAGSNKGVCTDYSSMFTVDIGGATLKDADSKNIDPGDIYTLKLDSISSKDPRPSSIFDDIRFMLPKGPLQIGSDPPPVYNSSPWDTDSTVEKNPAQNNLNINGIHINESVYLADATADTVDVNHFGIYYSLNDDTPSPWYHTSDDIPLRVKPDHPKTWWKDKKILDGEITFSVINPGWEGARVLPVNFEKHLALLPEPVETKDDDDIDGFDWMFSSSKINNQSIKQLYYTVSHEAHYYYDDSTAKKTVSLDPGDIYLYDSTIKMFQFPPKTLCDDKNLTAGKTDPDFDIDAIVYVEFPEKNNPLIPGATGKGWLFSFAPDDPATKGVDESGGHNPADIYWTPWSVYCDTASIEPPKKRFWKVISAVCTNDSKIPCLGLPKECSDDNTGSDKTSCDIDALSLAPVHPSL